MINIYVAIVSLILALVGIVMRKTYYYLPPRELKRQAEKHNSTAVSLYRAVAYGNSLRSLLWLYIGLTTAAGVVLLARSLNIWISLLIIGPVLWIAFSLIPATRVTRFGAWLTRLVTPSIAWILNYTHPLLSRSADAVDHRYIASNHTRLFEREDLLELIKRQQSQADNRLSEEELQIVVHALNFNDTKVSNIITPRKVLKTVLADDTIGPILIDELHKSGLSYVLVREKPKGQVIGTLAVGDLGIKSSGRVRDHMDDTVYYLHENDSLGEALHAFFVTNYPMFIVVNSFEEFVGIVSVESIIRELLGHIPGDDFDQYADPAAVANRYTKHPQPERSEKKEQKPDSLTENVIE